MKVTRDLIKALGPDTGVKLVGLSVDTGLPALTVVHDLICYAWDARCNIRASQANAQRDADQEAASKSSATEAT